LLLTETAALKVVEPTITDYETSRDIRVANNNKKLQELGLPTLAADFNKSIPESSTTTKGGKKTHSEDSDSSEYLLDDDDQGDSDDDDTESDELPEPVPLKVIILSP